MKTKRICLITSAHISYNPRLVKEADALAAAGYHVRVVAMDVEEEKSVLDKALMTARQWTLHTITARRNGSGHGRWLFATLRQRGCYCPSRLFNSDRCRVCAFSRYAPELARLAAHHQADLFIAHNLPALPAAARAAQRWSALIGYDAEDFHSGMRRLGLPASHEDELANRIEIDYLCRCDYLTAASPGVAAAVWGRFTKSNRPVSVLNVFSLTDRPARRPARPPGRPLQLYWFSQVIGADRGLEDAVRALKQLPEFAVELHLRARCNDDARRYLERVIDTSGVNRRAVFVHAPEAPDSLVRLAAQYDVGLALEVPISQNRIICMNDLCTNKVFTYMMAGLALVASATGKGGGLYGGAGFSYLSGDAGALASGLRRFLESPAELERAKDKSWDLATTRYNWEHEQKVFLTAVERALERQPASPS